MFFQRALYIFLLSCCGGCHTFAAEKKVEITELEDRLRVEIDGKLFTEYYCKNVPRPFCYPIIGPGEAPLTRDWPMKETPGEEQDHPHHRSLWFAHGKVNGTDFWSEQKNFGRQKQEKITFKSGEIGVIKSGNKWVTAEGKIVCEDERVLRFYNSSNPKILDYEITIKATEADVVLGDTKEGSMAIRLAETMRLKPNKSNEGKPTGHIVQSTGVRDADTWGKRAEWCDYYGPVNSIKGISISGTNRYTNWTQKIVGVAIFDHPKNPRHPTWWHVRDYGLFAANPFGIHDFEKKAAGEGDFTISKSQSAKFRYRFIFHEGNEKEANIEKLYEDFRKQSAR